MIKQGYYQALQSLKSAEQLRTIPRLKHDGKYVSVNGQDSLINIASNDYLGLGADNNLQDEFLDFIHHQPKSQRPKFGSTSSRLLTGNDIEIEQLEYDLLHWYGHSQDPQSQLSHAALIFNSGYHANLGLLPALTNINIQDQQSQIKHTLILADKLVHASIIDGIRLATLNNTCSYKRYKHNDHQHLRQLIRQAEENIGRIIIVTESIFSMDGDIADLLDLVTIKQSDNRIELYIDEAHAVGTMGQHGLGLAEVSGTLQDIDYLVGTFGKAFASMGAYLICNPAVKQWLINSMRPLIYSTALPPITHAWSRFILQKMPSLSHKRDYIAHISQQIRHVVEQRTGIQNPSQSPIIPYILGNNNQALKKAHSLQQAGFYALAIRPPTVPTNTSRIRIVMNAGIDEIMCTRLIESL